MIESQRRAATRCRKGLLLILWCAAAVCAAIVFLRPNELPPALAGTVLLDRDGLPLRVRLSADDRDLRPVDIASVSPWVVQALVAAEDQRFFRHPGIDPLALARALRQNLLYRRRVSGASTLSTQVVRLAEPRPRTPRTKLIEAVKALDLEQRQDKQAILGQYLDRAPFGGTLHGIESAARSYFDKSAADLTLAEAALLAGLPQAPSRLRPDRHPDAAGRRMRYVLDRMVANGFITHAQRTQALRQPLLPPALSRPFHAPHFCDLVLLRHPETTGTLRTTLDSGLQQAVEAIVARHLRDLSRDRVTDVAVVVLEVETGAVRALVGSPDYHHRAHHGMVNSALALRSPGSTLKPLIYGLALEQGLLTPGALLDDSPMILRDTTFANFEPSFRGEVSVRDALVLSLNIPALRVTSRVGLRETLDLLHALGLATLDRPVESYGLGIALGGGEVRLLDLVNAYACLARGGRHRPYHLLEGEADTEAEFRVFSPETAFLLADMLGGSERSLDLFGHVGDARLPRLAWKTGTSSGLRDAWTLAWNPDFVVGVWLGNHDGAGSPALVGARAAAPLAGDIFRHLGRADAGRWFTPPDGLRQRELADGTREWYVPGISAAPPPPRRTSGDRLQIASPASGSLFRLNSDLRQAQSIPLRARGNADGASLHWFANGNHLGGSTGALEWPLQPGEWNLTCVSPQGDRASVSIRVLASHVPPVTPRSAPLQ